MEMELMYALVGLSFCQPNEFLNLVLSFSGHVVSTEDHLDVAPLRILGYALGYIVLQML